MLPKVGRVGHVQSAYLDDSGAGQSIQAAGIVGQGDRYMQFGFRALLRVGVAPKLDVREVGFAKLATRRKHGGPNRPAADSADTNRRIRHGKRMPEA